MIAAVHHAEDLPQGMTHGLHLHNGRAYPVDSYLRLEYSERAAARARLRFLSVDREFELCCVSAPRFLVGSMVLLAACSGSGYAVRPSPRIAADNVGKPVSVLQEAFGEPRKIDKSATKLIYVWFLPQKPKEGTPSGFQGCEMEVTVDPRSAARARLLVVEHRLVYLPRRAAAHSSRAKLEQAS